MFGIAAVSVVNPMLSERVFDKWFSLPEVILLAPIPVVCTGVAIGVDRYLSHFLRRRSRTTEQRHTCAEYR